MKPLKIGKLKLKNRIFLAPMLDITDLPYRLICREAGAGMAYTEMINVPAIIHENKKTSNMMKTCKEDSPLGIQITGGKPEELKKIIPVLKKYDLVDLNCGCPSERIIGNDSGSYLLNHPEKIAEMVKILKKKGLAVTAKIRLGFKINNVIEIAKIIEKAGADAITVHARLANEGYDKKADWSWIKKVKKVVKIPVIGNGDIASGRDASEMLEICDGAMIGRASIGDVEIFERIDYYLKNGKEKERNFDKNLDYFLKYLEYCNKYDMVELTKVKRIGCHFIKGIKNAGKIRNEIMKSNSLESMKAVICRISLK